MLSHLTLYVGEPLLSTGGTVIVASVPLPVDEWRALDGEDPAEADDTNAKRAQLAEGDRLFGAHVDGPVSFVEMYYPEGGTFGFNLVPDPDARPTRPLVTERILVGSGGWHDWETGERHEWPDTSTIHIDGRNANKGNSRLVTALQDRIMSLKPEVKRFSGARIYTPSRQQILEGTWNDYQ